MNIHEIYRLIEGISLTQFTGAGIIIVTRKGKVLLLKKQSGSWGMPGGKPSEDELPIETAIRETEEETGIKIDSLKDPIVFYYKDKKYYSYVYVVERESIVRLSKEHKNFKWVYFKELEKYKLVPPLRSQLSSYIAEIEKTLNK